MRAALTLINVYEQDAQKVGVRAVDLARIARAQHPVPPSFVIPCSIFEEFMSQSGIRAKLPKIYAEHPSTPDGYARAYKFIKGLFQEVSFSGPIKEELIESYESLALPLGAKDAEHLVSQEQEPNVLLLLSPTYEPTKERLAGLVPSVTGEEHFLEAVKDCWLSLFTPSAVINRQERNIASFSTGIIVQQQLTGSSVEGTYSFNKEHPITILAYRGLPDVTGDIPKDEYSIRVEHLEIAKSTIRQQPYRMISTNKKVEKEYLQSLGSEPSLDDKEVLESARLTKRIHILLETDLTLFFSVHKDVRVLFCLRNASFSEQAHVVDKPIDAESIDELEEFDPDTEDLGLAEQEDTIAIKEDYSEPTPSDECIEEVYDELVANDHPVTIMDEQHSDDEQTTAFRTPIADDRVPTPDHSTAFRPLSNDIRVPTPDHSTAFHPPFTDHSVLTPEQPSTLFDVYTPQRTPEQTFVINTHQQLSDKLRSLHQQPQESISYEELLDQLEQQQLLPHPKNDILFLARCAEYSQNNQPLDEHLGVAWRLSR